MAREMNISKRSMSRLLSEDLGLRAYRRRTGHYLDARLKNQRVLKCSRRLLQRHAHNGHRRILFTDEKFSQLKRALTAKMIRFMHQPLRKPVKKFQKFRGPITPPQWGVSYSGATQLHFCEKGLKRVPECMKAPFWSLL